MTDSITHNPSSTDDIFRPDQNPYAGRLWAIEFATHDGQVAWRLNISGYETQYLCIPRVGEYVDTRGRIGDHSSFATHRVGDVVWAPDLSLVRIIFEAPYTPEPVQMDQLS